MKKSFNGWAKVAKSLLALKDDPTLKLNEGQIASIKELAKRLPKNGVIIADEVGMGKTRIAVAVAKCVIAEGGRVAILVPPGVGSQWNDELREAQVFAPPLLRSLRQYLNAWQEASNSEPWFKVSALVISHSFTNWHLGVKAASWRWALLPEIFANWQKITTNRFPNGYLNNEISDDKLVKKAARSIVDDISRSQYNHPARNFINKMTNNTSWSETRKNCNGEYGQKKLLRSSLECAVGLGLGVFDLVIVDEAHKSRGEESRLNGLLNDVILQSSSARRLAMTATPIELNLKQWEQILSRIKLPESSMKNVKQAIEKYDKAVDRVRLCPSDQTSRIDFKKSASEFKLALNEYLLRRDKRQDPAVKKFQEHCGEGISSYRREHEIKIDTTQLNNDWKRAVCAAEALSFVARKSGDNDSKRMRLTIGNGHGIATMIDLLHQNDIEDAKQNAVDVLNQNKLNENHQISIKTEPEKELSNTKSLQRTKWWQQVLMAPFQENESALFDHPGILAAVEVIEKVCQLDEKTLVFGRFTRPLRALTQLLNAREMLRCIDNNRPWPQSKVYEDTGNKVNDEWSAIVAAHRQLKRSGEIDRNQIDNLLKEQYDVIEQQRENFRKHLIIRIEEGLKNKQTNRRMQVLFDLFKNEVQAESVRDKLKSSYGKGVLVIVARAMQDLLGLKDDNVTSATSEEFAKVFINLIDAASDQDDSDKNDDGEFDEAETTKQWGNLKARLNEEYSRTEGGFARLMFGETKPSTRRLLQLAFNRKQGHPKVLVAQSLVGREGLNLHKACRTVVLLHPEWNPGVVEQQIGRVDRIGSLWEVKLNQSIADNKTKGDLPRIEIHPIVFQGTYDEKNWQVLHERWDDLRAQLHGIVISPRIANKYSNADALIAEINGAAPNFSPNLSES